MRTAALALSVVATLAVAGCHRATPEAKAVQANAAAMEASLTNQADVWEREADQAANADAAAAMQNAAETLKDARDNVADTADATIDNLR